MNQLNTLSSTLGSQAASGTALAINTNSDQTVQASSGAAIGGNRVFNVTSFNTGKGENLIIKGDGSQGVVLDINTPGDAQFHGNVLLQDLSGKFFGDAGYAGLFPDQVLFSLYAGAAAPGDVDAWLLRGDLDRILKRDSAAAYRKVLEIDPKNVLARVNLASMEVAAEKYDDARVLLDELHKLAPDNPIAS